MSKLGRRRPTLAATIPAAVSPPVAAEKATGSAAEPAESAELGLGLGVGVGVESAGAAEVTGAAAGAGGTWGAEPARGAGRSTCSSLALEALLDVGWLPPPEVGWLSPLEPGWLPSLRRPAAVVARSRLGVLLAVDWLPHLAEAVREELREEGEAGWVPPLPGEAGW